MMDNIEISGPFIEYSSPFGKVLSSLNMKRWYVSRKLKEEEIKTEVQKLFKTKSLGSIVRFDRNPKRYVIDRLYPIKSYNSLKKAVNFLIKNENKLVFCT